MGLGYEQGRFMSSLEYFLILLNSNSYGEDRII